MFYLIKTHTQIYLFLILILFTTLTITANTRNFHRFSQQKTFKNKLNDPMMNAILMECPKTSPSKTDITNCDEKLLVNVRVESNEKVKKYRQNGTLTLEFSLFAFFFVFFL